MIEMAPSESKDTSFRDDEMDPERYEYPPGLMPDADVEFDTIKTDSVVTIYKVGDAQDHYIKSDQYVHLFR